MVLLLSTAKLGPGSYRLGLVREVVPDPQGLVRTVVVALKSRRRRGAGTWVEEQRMAVQRLAVLLPVEERWGQGVVVPGGPEEEGEVGGGAGGGPPSPPRDACTPPGQPGDQ